MAAFASSSQVPCRKYEVFISFRGRDVRSGFLSHLVKELRGKCIEVYVDDRLERGKEISSELMKAIEESMIALVIFSKDYASSEWCLEELVKIMESKEANQQIVIPIFYHVDPSYVRHQKLTYADAFILHEKKFKNKVEIWRSVLEKSADLSGYHSLNFQKESNLIDEIVEDVWKKLIDNSRIEPKSHLIGFRQNFTSVESLMEIKSREAQILGIWGMGGIGKTTLAHVVFDEFSPKFKSRCFLENVREKLTKGDDLSSLRQKLVCELLKQKDHINMNDAMRRLQGKKVLIVLDDVDDAMHLKYLAGQQHVHLAPGSRIIVTSRDKHVLESGGIHDKYIHEVKQLSHKESLELFCIHAFNQSHPNLGYQELSKKTVAIAKGIPLALEVLGSHFHSRDKAYWESELTKLQKYPHKEIQNILKISYDGLDFNDKEIFLDIAFFFMREGRDKTTCVLEACGFEAVSGIQNLMDKALIKSAWDNSIVMHDLIREMAEQIVREEDCRHPERRSRLKDANEICDIWESDMGTEEIQGIILDTRQREYLQLGADIFSKMKKLRILKLFAFIELPFSLNSFPNTLRCLHWDYYPLESLPSGCCFKKLVELHMEGSNVKKLWDGKQDLANLKKINLRGSKQLMKLPNLSMAYRLEIVDLCDCINLRSVHPSILSHHTIDKMYVSGCKKLESLVSETHLESLSYLEACGCDSFERFCLSSKKLRDINLSKSGVKELWLPIGRFIELRELNVGGERLKGLAIDELCGLTNLEVFEVTNFKQLIDTMKLHSLFYAWRNLRKLYLEGWSDLSEIPGSIEGLTRLESLSLNDSVVETLPAWINHLSCLRHISLRRCKRLKSILGLPPFLEKLDARECTLLETISSDSLLQNQCDFRFYNCVKLDKSSLRFIEELTHSSMTSARSAIKYDCFGEACYPRSRVPKWMKYKQMTEASNAIQFTCNLKRSQAIVFCCVAPRHPLENLIGIFCNVSYNDNNKFPVAYDGGDEERLELNSDHVFLWHMEWDSYDDKISCQFFLKYRNEENVKYEVPVDACGVHLIYSSESEWDSDSDSDSDSELAAESSKYCRESESGQKRKRVADICVENERPPTKQLKNFGVSQPSPLEFQANLEVLDAWRNLRKLCLDGWSYLLKIPDSIKRLTRLKSELESESGRKRKRVTNICVEDGLPPTKQLKNSGVSRDDFLCHSLQLKFLGRTKQKDLTHTLPLTFL